MIDDSDNEDNTKPANIPIISVPIKPKVEPKFEQNMFEIIEISDHEII